MSLFEKLRTLVDQLQAIPRALEDLSAAIRRATERDSHSAGTEDRIRADIRHKEATEKLRSVEYKEQISIQRWMARGTWAAFLAAVFYASVAVFQWCEMHTQNANISRAWVGYQQAKDSNLPVTIDLVEVVPRVTVEAHYTIENFGNGPAIKVIPEFLVETDNDLATLKAAAASICSSAVKFASGTVPYTDASTNPGRMGFTLFPRQTYIDARPWNEDAKPELRWMYVMGCVAYLDQFKSPHWTRFVVLIGDGKSAISNASPRKLYTLFNDTDETSEKDQFK